MVTGQLNIENARVFLTTQFVTNLEVTLLIDEWQNWQASIKKDVLSSSYKETTFPFTFVKGAATALETAFNTYFANAKGTVDVWVDWENDEPNVSYTYELDFSTYEKSDKGVSISCRVQNLRTLIKKNGGTEFSINVNDVSNGMPLKYTSNVVKNTLRLKRIDTTTINKVYMTLPLPPEEPNLNFRLYTYHAVEPIFTFASSDITVKDSLEYFEEAGVKPVKIKRDGRYTLKYITSGELCSISLFTQAINDETQENSNVLATAIKNEYPGSGQTLRATYYLKVNSTVVASAYRIFSLSERTTEPFNLHFAAHIRDLDSTLLEWTGDLNIGDEISMVIAISRHPTPAIADYVEIAIIDGHHSTLGQTFNFWGNGALEISYFASNSISRNIKCVKTSELIKNLLQKISGKRNIKVNVLAAHINDIVLVARDSMAGKSVQEIKISYNNIASFLKMLCCDVVLKENEIDIVPIYGENGVFDVDKIEAFSYGEDECADLRMSYYSEIAYSEIEIGSKIEEKEIGDSQEFNIAATYISKANTTNKLDLTTTIRTDTTGFEKMLPLEESDNNDSDKTIFAFDVNTINGAYYVPKTTYTSADPLTFVNGSFAPRNLLNRWMPILNATADTFIPVSSTKSMNISVAGEFLGLYISQYYDAITPPSVLPVEFDLATSDGINVLSKELINGKVKFTYNGEDYFGFVLSIDENPLVRKQKEIKLLKSGDGFSYLTFPYDIYNKQQEIIINCKARLVSTTFIMLGGLLSSLPENSLRFTQNWAHALNENYSQRYGIVDISVLSNNGSERTCDVYIKLPDNKEYLLCTIIQRAYAAENVDIQTVELSGNGEVTDDTSLITLKNMLYANPTSWDLNAILSAPNHFTFGNTEYVPDGRSIDLYQNIAPYIVPATKQLDEERISVFCFGKYNVGNDAYQIKNFGFKLVGVDYVLPVKFKFI